MKKGIATSELIGIILAIILILIVYLAVSGVIKRIIG